MELFLQEDMCGQFSLGASASTLATQFQLIEVPARTRRHNITTTQAAPCVVRSAGDSHRHFSPHRWGLIPARECAALRGVAAIYAGIPGATRPFIPLETWCYTAPPTPCPLRLCQFPGPSQGAPGPLRGIGVL